MIVVRVLVVEDEPKMAGLAEDAITIAVREHGPGFDPDFLPRAFGRFTRADDARTRGGTGLGLAIVAAPAPIPAAGRS